MDELSEAFVYIKDQQGSEFERFLDQAYVFFKSQAESGWVSMINKSSRSRMLAEALVSKQVKQGNYQFFGLFNQLHDDLKDVDLDYQEGNITPFVSLIYHRQLSQGIHPYQLYWALLHHLIYHCYDRQPKVKELLIKRCINSHRALQEQLGEAGFTHRLAQLTQGCEALIPLTTTLTTTLTMPLEMAWFDKYLSRQLQQHLTGQTVSPLQTRVTTLRRQITPLLALDDNNEVAQAANYALDGGKHFRALLCTIYAQDCLALSFEEIAPVLQFIEYMHSASLILDDKPSQDNADMRCGKPTLHRHLASEAKAEITAVNLIFKAVETHAGMTHFPAEQLRRSMVYAGQVSQKICYGQWLDLDAQNQSLNLTQLQAISQHKTAFAIESALVLPAILCNQPAAHIEQLKAYAYHLGIAFQIKDDLLDIESDTDTLGKPAQLDQHNQASTYVRCLGRQGAIEQLHHHYYRAVDALTDIDNAQALAQIAGWLIARDH